MRERERERESLYIYIYIERERYIVIMILSMSGGPRHPGGPAQTLPVPLAHPVDPRALIRQAQEAPPRSRAARA